MATMTQVRIIVTPIVALLERAISEIAQRNQAIGDDTWPITRIEPADS
jgi:hypothetical protein